VYTFIFLSLRDDYVQCLFLYFLKLSVTNDQIDHAQISNRYIDLLATLSMSYFLVFIAVTGRENLEKGCFSKKSGKTLKVRESCKESSLVSEKSVFPLKI